MKRIKLFLSALVLSLSSFGVLLTSHAFAATLTWTGGGSDNNMTTAANWGGSAPVAGDDLVFPANVTNRTVNNDFTANTSFNSITFSGAATQNSNYTLDGNAMTVVGGIANTMTGSFNTDQTINFAVKFNGTQTVDPGITLGGALNINGSTVTFDTGGNITTLSGVISGTGSIIETGDGYLLLSGANTFDASIAVTQGILVAGNAAALGSATGGTTVASGSSLIVYQPITDQTFAEPLNLSGNGHDAYTPTLMLQASFGGGGGVPSTPYPTYTFSGAVTLGSDVTVGVYARNGKLTGAITGSHAINFYDKSVGTFEVASSGNGSTTTNQILADPIKQSTYSDDQSGTSIVVYPNETAIVNGKRGSVTLYSGATLKGSGTVGSLDSQGTVAPGQSPGCLSTGDLTLLSSSTYQAEIGGTTACTGYDQLTVTGTVAVDGTLSVTRYNKFVPKTGQKYVIVSNDGNDAVTGTFKNLAEGAKFDADGVTWSISYKGGDGNDIELTVTAVSPDTGFMVLTNNPYVTMSVILGAAGGIALLARRQFRPAFATRRRR